MFLVIIVKVLTEPLTFLSVVAIMKIVVAFNGICFEPLLYVGATAKITEQKTTSFNLISFIW